MSTEHVVAQGDCLASIARKYGFPDWKTIYDHPENAELRTKRPDPHVLFPGDRVQIPDKQRKQEDGATEQRHKFQLAAKETRLRLVVRDVDGQPIARKKYELSIAGQTRKGVLSADGKLDEPIPADALQGTLQVWIEDERPTLLSLRLGHLDPIETTSGIQARLNNLGYAAGPVDGIDGPRTQAAVRKFQKDHSLEADGVAGAQTRDALKAQYGC